MLRIDCVVEVTDLGQIGPLSSVGTPNNASGPAAGARRGSRRGPPGRSKQIVRKLVRLVSFAPHVHEEDFMFRLSWYRLQLLGTIS